MRMADITLYYFPGSYASEKAVLALFEKEAPFKKHLINIHSEHGDQNEPWYMRMNPKGLVPVLQDGDKIVCESDDIIDYIDKHVHSGSTLVPDVSSEAGKEVARLRDVFNHVQYDVITYGVLLNPEMSVTGCKIPGSKFANAQTLSKRMANQFAYSQSMMEKHPDLKEAYEAKLKFRASFKGNSADLGKVKAAMESCDRVMDDIEVLLGKIKERYGIPDSWLVGPRFTAADVTFAILLHRLELLGLEERFYPKNKRPHVHDYYKRLIERKSVQQVISEEKKILAYVMRSKLKKGLPYVAAVATIGVAIVAAFTLMKRAS